MGYPTVIAIFSCKGLKLASRSVVMWCKRMLPCARLVDGWLVLTLVSQS